MDDKRFFFLSILLSLVFVVDCRSAFDQQLYEDVLDPVECLQQLRLIANDTLRIAIFADSSASIPSGIFSGNLNDMGDYFQCLSINQVVDQSTIEGKYCMVQVPLDQDLPELPSFPVFPGLPIFPRPPFPRPPLENEQVTRDYLKLKSFVHQLTGGYPINVESRIFPSLSLAGGAMSLAVCIPKVCTVEETAEFIGDIVGIFNLTYSMQYCRLPNDKPFAPADYTAMAVFSIIAALVLVSTAYDLYLVFYLEIDNKRVHPLLTCFSVYTNTKRFLTFNTSAGALECIDGIRAISMLWVIIGHTYCMTLLGYVHNLRETFQWLLNLSSVWIISAPIVVDTFFVISGILVVYTTIGKMSRTRFIRSLHLFYLNRLLRIFPLLGAVVLLQASVLNHVSDGPFWQNVAHATESCRDNWWTALLYVQNYVNPLTVCLVHTWYLSVDTQLYFLCPLVLYFLFGRERLAWAALTMFLFLSLLSSSLYSFLNNYSAALGNPNRLPEFADYMQNYYINTLTRAPPFFIGMICGYLLYLSKDRKIRISKFTVLFLWINSLGMMAFCIFSIHPVMQSDHTAQTFDNFLNAYMRAIWGLAMSWLIFACVKGYGGPINWFLSLGMWKLLARMSFAMYLVHLPIIMIVNGSWVKTFYFSEGLNWYRFFGDVSLSFLAAFALSITIDAPFSTIQKFLNGSGRKPRQPATSSTTTVETDTVIKTAL